MRRPFALLCLVWASSVAAQQTDAQIAAAAAQFGARPGIEGIDISPDGHTIAYLAPGPGPSTILVVQGLDGGQPRGVLRTDGNPERVRWCSFVSNERLICRVTVLVEGSNTLVPFARLISIGLDGGDAKLLGERDSIYDTRVRQYDGGILDWLPGDGNAVLMVRDHVPQAEAGTRLARTADGLSVDRIDVRTLRARTVEPANRLAAGYTTDGRGAVRIMQVSSVRGATGQMQPSVEFLYRPDGSREWRHFSTYDRMTREGEYPIAVDAELGVAYTLRKQDGRMALYRVRLDGSLASELVYANDRVDVDDVVRVAHGARVVGLTFADEARRVRYFDPGFEAMLEALGRALPNLPMLEVVGGSQDGNRLLVHGSSDTDSGRYFLFDRAAHQLNELLVDRPQLEQVPLAPVRPVSYSAPDGVEVPAYLTLPPGSDGRGLPAIVLPHGGPEARDIWGFDWLAQYFARLGYAVLQPNFRGSAGYGDAWLVENGFRGWRTSIGDVSAGARWLASQGIADPGRIAIVGWSYGGYAALQAGVTDPDLYRAIVAIAPVTDLEQLKTDAEHFTNAALVAEYVGSGPQVAEGSPARNAARIAAPVLLFHGDRDLNVGVIHSRRMSDALTGAGKRVELTVYPGLEHDLDDSQARTDMLARIGRFLRRELANQ